MFDSILFIIGRIAALEQIGKPLYLRWLSVVGLAAYIIAGGFTPVFEIIAGFNHNRREFPHNVLVC